MESIPACIGIFCITERGCKGVSVLIILGYIVVIGSVLGGYALVGGEMGALFQPTELLIIGGAGVGAFLVGNCGKSINKTLKSIPLLFRGSKYTKKHYLDLMTLQFRLLSKSRQQGVLALENDIESPVNSEIFKSYPALLGDTMIVNFITDYLRLIISGNMSAFEIESLMDEEIETYEYESDGPAKSLAAAGDGLPAFGIVATVMGVVHALASADRPAAELGELIAHAMVGTFLGILLSYGFVSPLASVLRQKYAENIKMMQCIKVTLLSSMHGYPPQIAVEFGRKVLYSSERPSFSELEEYVRDNKTVKTSAEQDT